MPNTELLTVAEAAARLRLRRQATYRLIASGVLATVVLGRRRFVTVQAIERAIKRSTQAEFRPLAGMGRPRRSR